MGGTRSDRLPPAAPVAADATDSAAPKRKRRTLRDAEQELEECRSALKEAKRKLIVTARENAKMKVLLMKYIEKDDSLLCSSQLSVTDTEPSNSQQVVVSDASTGDPSGATQSTVFSSSLEDEDDSENSSLWTSEFSTDIEAHGDAGLAVEPNSDTTFGPVSQLSQLSQVSQWSELSTTSNLDEIISFLEKQDVHESERVATMEAEFKELKAASAVVRVGVGVILTSSKFPGSVLIGERKGSHGAGKFALPGGHLEMFESWSDCAIREVKEETDLDLTPADLSFAYVTNDPMEDEGKHYITIFMHARVREDQVPRNMEPHKCQGWSWVPWESLRTRNNLFIPLYHITHESSYTPPFDGVKPIAA
ncbi:hypothetical protein P43SY_011105 [Pythium insidiosum]|uniref:Nudix hydrolase domain-containing protein n=1 Tax=Pythium insidiosum TaxID=114742 RepID=A0AAD5LSE3_PYTIN|nr:hypothetical protein P43SY_011105 [Pythium insidiosum]